MGFSPNNFGDIFGCLVHEPVIHFRSIFLMESVALNEQLRCGAA